MQKTILIGALLLGTLAQADMDRCNSAVNLWEISLDKSKEAYRNKDFKGACSYAQLANSFVEDAMRNCPAKLQASLQEAYVEARQLEATICNIK